ncbi:hypothetical protein GYW75_07050 [Gilliamella sp. ESL0232]|uniref:hypothetical protein n=2 Tax=Orbaceae TaxID=1240483 RepID=UPI00158077EA|nr:hypothetical protein [Gilliamella sp.]MCO6555817.1 hypothetical protein [Gilliamella sp.]NUE96143.1 hypothetical protein [Gilliamella sp. ESL0232]
MAGETVAIGTLVMLIDSNSDMIETVYNFCESVGLSTMLAEFGLANTSDEELMKIVIKVATTEGLRRK